MGQEQSAFFYSNLFVHSGELHQVYSNRRNFRKVPEAWNIVVTDVKNSTEAIKNDKHREVNLAATGSIVACLNISREKGLEIPFFFGGDGATLLIPDVILEECLHALRVHQDRCQEFFDLFLRVGYRKVSEMIEKGGVLNICKFKRNNFHITPLIQGDALQRAENEIKQSEELGVEELQNQLLNLEGMECKWDKIAPLDRQNEVLSLIINAKDVQQQHDVYAAILKEIDVIYGNEVKRNPVSLERLKMVTNLRQLKNEVTMKYATSDLRHLLGSVARSIFGKYYMKFTQKGRNYLNELIQLTEVLLMDGSINTVITGNEQQRKQLFEMLDNMERNLQIKYGFYSSKSSVLSCYVTAIDDYHIHFLDGDNGGYTQASVILKSKI